MMWKVAIYQNMSHLHGILMLGQIFSFPNLEEREIYTIKSVSYLFYTIPEKLIRINLRLK